MTYLLTYLLAGAEDRCSNCVSATANTCEICGLNCVDFALFGAMRCISKSFKFAISFLKVYLRLAKVYLRFTFNSREAYLLKFVRSTRFGQGFLLINLNQQFLQNFERGVAFLPTSS